MTAPNPPPAFTGWWQALPEALRESYRAGPAIMAAHAGWVAATEAKSMEDEIMMFDDDQIVDDWKAGQLRVTCAQTAPEELTPVDWRALEPLEQDALRIAGRECDTPFCDWFDARWSGKVPAWAMPPHDRPSDCLRLHPMLWDEWVARYWGTLTPEDRREHLAWKAAEGYAEELAWCEAEAAKAEGLA